MNYFSGVKKTYRYRLYPDKTQESLLRQTFGCCRFVYNYALDAKIKAYEKDKMSLSEFDCNRLIPSLKAEYPWLSEVPAVCLPQAVRNMISAYNMFFKTKRGFPKFKSKHRSVLSCKFPSPFCTVLQDVKRIKLSKIGLVRYKQDRTFAGELKSITVKCDSCGRFWACCLVETGVAEPTPAIITSASECVGVDLGLKDFIVTSDGVRVPNPRYADVLDRRISRLQKLESRKQKGSRHHAAIRLKINRLYARKRNLIMNFIHHVVNDLLGENQAVIIEDLNVQGMMGNHRLARSIQGVCWSEFVRVLEYKARWFGKTVVKVGRFFPSSKTCGVCGYKNNDLTLSDRSWTCPECGCTHDRDLNAAINILHEGLMKLMPVVGGFDGRRGGGYEADEASIYIV